MIKIKKFFETPKKAILSSVCIVAALAVLGGGSVLAANAAAKSYAIGETSAQNYAFADAGVDPASATILKTEFDFDDGHFVYDIEFVANGYEYDYQVKSSDGTILKRELDPTGAALTGQGTVQNQTQNSDVQNQTQNSATPIATFMERFNMFVQQVSTKKLKYIQQFYPERRYFEIAGKIADIDMSALDLNRTGHLEYDLSVRQSTETPVYRMLANETLLEFWRAGAIQLEDMLSLSSLPFSDALLQKIQSRRKELEAGENALPQPPGGAGLPASSRE